MAIGETRTLGSVLLIRTPNEVMVVFWHVHESTFCDWATHQTLLEGLVTSRSALTTLERVARTRSAARGRKFINLTMVAVMCGDWVCISCEVQGEGVERTVGCSTGSEERRREGG